MTDAGHPDALSAESKRVAPRSPRAALEPEYMPEPKRPSRRARHPLVIAGNAIFTIILVVAIAGGLVYSYGKHKLEAAGPLDREKIVNIPRGLGLREIADLLARENVIDQPFVFIGGVLVLKAKDDLKYGEYKFPKQITVREAIETIVEGKVVQHAFTIPEGLTSEQIVARLAEVDFLAGNIREVPKEGTLLPETYNFPRGTTREQAIQRMQQTHRRVLQEIWERRSPDIPVKTAEALVTLASIVEKETGRPDERSRVAAVFSNRLRQRIKLQSDPTIIYGLVGGKGTLGRPIMRSEIEQPTPYNTYVVEGLPPGPIANPGRASLEATANPARTKEIFFVADGTGGHAFAENLQQHQQNVARLRQFEQQVRTPAPADRAMPFTEPTASAAVPAPPAAPAPAKNAKQKAKARTQ
ncbi:MAG: endolytic transglycosylase MltG [Alphaproteobacteria bacterium]|nr:MAG: endolytic transglycosylase MltG [Alphaproteobacteria bacterium]